MIQKTGNIVKEIGKDFQNSLTHIYCVINQYLFHHDFEYSWFVDLFRSFSILKTIFTKVGRRTEQNKSIEIDCIYCIYSKIQNVCIWMWSEQWTSSVSVFLSHFFTNENISAFFYGWIQLMIYFCPKNNNYNTSNIFHNVIGEFSSMNIEYDGSERSHNEPTRLFVFLFFIWHLIISRSSRKYPRNKKVPKRTEQYWIHTVLNCQKHIIFFVHRLSLSNYVSYSFVWFVEVDVCTVMYTSVFFIHTSICLHLNSVLEKVVYMLSLLIFEKYFWKRLKIFLRNVFVMI